MMAILHQLRDRGHTVIIVTHDPQVAAQAERVIEIRDALLRKLCGSPTIKRLFNVAGRTVAVRHSTDVCCYHGISLTGAGTGRQI
ncbi:hypothetical protein [Escherichia coli]|uniref:hypothetical protein n=1 Tax=Escherichia coli TaxID=562 RepID=UPI0022385325|nr:hypothetical protein [Escherichia coli]MCW7343027.1 hypothetical protein [Escherichia coli]